MRHVLSILAFFVLVLLGVCLPVASALGQSSVGQEEKSKIKRLILKDGSYELISQYTIQGDRVRYFSTERHNWEEMPSSMIDWAATEQFAGQQAHEASERMNEALDKASKERSEEEAHMPLVAPGVKLPSPDGVFLLDSYQGKPELNSLFQNGADYKKNTGGNILRGVINPIASSKQTVELQGLHARIQSHTSEPALYFAIDTSDPLRGYSSTAAKDHLRIVRCEAKKGNRIVVTYNIAIYGKVKQQARYVETKVEAVSDYWVKVTPATPLQSGEYALVELDDKGSMNQFVWDFGVNPAAPANPAIVLENPERSEPALIQKPRKKANP